MMKYEPDDYAFRPGDRVRLRGTYIWQRREFSKETRECKDLVGTITGFASGCDDPAYEVDWGFDDPWGADEACLEDASPEPTDEEVAEAITSIQTSIRKDMS